MILDNTSSVWSVVAFKNDKIIASGDKENIKIWDSVTGDLIKTIPKPGNSLIEMTDGRLISGSGMTIKIWDKNTGQLLLTCIDYQYGVNCIALLNESYTASGSTSNQISIWNVETYSDNKYRRVKILNGHTDEIWSLVAMDDYRLCSGSKDTTIKIWNLISGKELKTLKGHTDTVRSLMVLPNQRLASGSYDKAIIIWDIETSSIIFRLEGHKSYIWSMVLLKDEMTLVSASDDKTIRLWNISTGELMKSIEAHTDAVRSLAVLEDGRLISGSNDNSIIIWK